MYAACAPRATRFIPPHLGAGIAVSGEWVSERIDTGFRRNYTPTGCRRRGDLEVPVSGVQEIDGRNPLCLSCRRMTRLQKRGNGLVPPALADPLVKQGQMKVKR